MDNVKIGGVRTAKPLNRLL